MGYRQAKLYVTSGTGNTLRVANWLKGIFENHCVETRVLRTEEIEEKEDKAESSAESGAPSDHLLGVCMPTHGFTSPWHVLKFVLSLPPGQGSHAFALSTRAGIRLGPLLLPGISGSNSFLIALLLFLKGYRVRSLESVDMPSNWYSLHPMQGGKTRQAIYERTQKRLQRLFPEILAGKRVFFTLNNLYELVFALLLSPVSFLYLFVGRFFLAKLFFANNACDGCGVCAMGCPVQAIRLMGRKKPRPFWRYNCESCMRCAALCPHNAVEAGHSWGAVLYFCTTIPANYLLVSWFAGLSPLAGYVAHNPLLLKGIKLAYFMPALFLSYMLFYLCLRLKFVNWFFTKTTLTHYWGRYREPGTTRKELMGKTRSDRND